MSRRSRGPTTSNLELLLDTMCNAFGGVIFIAMLLAVLSQFSDVASPTQTASRVTELQAQIKMLEKEVSSLRAALKQQEGIMEAFKGDSEDASRLNQTLKELHEKNQALKENIRRTQKAAKEAREKARKEGRSASEIEDDVADIKKDIEAGKTKIEGLEKGEIRALYMRKARRSQKITVFLILKWNRLFIVRRPAGNNPNGPPNTDALSYRKLQTTIGGQRRDVERFKPLQGKGIPLDAPRWNEDPRLGRLLRVCDPDKHSFQFAVYPDSYDSFCEVRNFLKSKGYEWNWHIVGKPDQPIQLVPGKTSTTQG
jgi:hypothetical protein